MKRKIELPKDSEIVNKLNLGLYLTNIEYITNNLHNDDLAVLQAALQEAYNQGYEDARPRWLPMSEANTTDAIFITDNHNYCPWVLIQDSYGNVMQARFWWSKDGKSFNWLERGGSAVFPEKWMPLPNDEP